MESGLKGKRALVTGASSGIGQAVAQALAAEGVTIAVHARNDARAKSTLDSIKAQGGTAFAVAADMEKPDEVRRMCERAIERLGGIDIVVNNAGVADLSSVTAMEERLWDSTMNVNLKAPFLVCKHTLPTMIEQKSGGSVLFTSSTNGNGLIGFMKCLAAEMGVHNIRVNAVCPGWAVTKMAENLHRKMAESAGRPYEEFFDDSMRLNMLHSLIPAKDNADMYVFLASERGRNITGQAINVCGGLCYW
jgi:NAD(P)-dependent dehydrogenase (short-subunit alcohol dehydrogenase family)